MGGKSSGSTNNYERELSAQELQLLDTQNQQLEKGIAVAEQQEARAAEQYNNWQNTYQGIETGLIPQDGNRDNGFYGNGVTPSAPREARRLNSNVTQESIAETIQRQLPNTASAEERQYMEEQVKQRMAGKGAQSRYPVSTNRR